MLPLRIKKVIPELSSKNLIWNSAFGNTFDKRPYLELWSTKFKSYHLLRTFCCGVAALSFFICELAGSFRQE